MPDYFLKIDGIEGESRTEGHEGSIDLDEFSWGLSNSGSAIQGSARGGMTVFQDFHFVSRVSKASPKLFLACATGQPIQQAILSARKENVQGALQEYYKVTLDDIIISSFQQSASQGSEDLIPMDQYSLNFSKIEIEYKEQKEDGTLDSPVKAGYDIKANKKV